MKIVRPVVRTVGGLQHTVRDLGRLREVATVLVRRGFGLLVNHLDIPGLRSDNSRTLQSTPEQLVLALQELGPTFIKLGQVLSTRPELLGPSYIQALEQLQDDVLPLSFEVMETVLREVFGEDWKERFSSVEEEALATASIAQVHRARLKDGREIVLKIQRPGLHDLIQADLGILSLLVSRIETEFPELDFLDLTGVLAEFERSILTELDFKGEAKNTKHFASLFSDEPRVVIPEVIDELSESRVLCLQLLHGVKLREAELRGMDMSSIGLLYIQLAYRMLFEFGEFHGDLHPGNLLVQEDGRLILLDFGITGQLTREMQDYLVALIFALERGDLRTCTRIFYDISIKEGRVNYTDFERDVIDVVRKNWVKTTFGTMQIGNFLSDVTRGAIRHRVRAPPSYTLFFRALLTTEGLARSLLPNLNPLEVARPYVEKILGERFGPERLKEDAIYHTMTLSSLGRRVPTVLSHLLDDIELQRLSVELRHPQTERLMEKKVKVEEDRVWAIVLCALFGAGAIRSLGTSATIDWITLLLNSLGFLILGHLVLRRWRR